MNRIHHKLLFALIGCAGIALAAEDEVVFKPISITGQFDNGHIVKGRTHKDILNGFENKKMDMDFFTRTSVWLTQEATVNERFTISVGVGGILWYTQPAIEKDPLTMQTMFGPGISQAQGVYKWGDLENPSATLQVGYFPYKYNPDAKNLGEYLLRSGTYPGYLVTGGWNMISSAAFMAQGARVNVPLWGGKFESDFILAMETNLPPLFSLSPTYVATVKPINGIRVGAGISCNHCISARPSLESANRLDNAYITGFGIDSADNDVDGTADDFKYRVDRDSSHHYTFQGIKVSANASVDPKAFFPMDFLGPEDLKIYGEIAVLGWKNYPYYYEKRTERMPIMGGINLPTFKLLDVLSLEVEYYNNQFANNYRDVLYDAYPTWPIFNDASGYPTKAELEAVIATAADYDKSWNDRDNWKWTVYGKKEVTKGIRIYAQAASDHLRTFNFNFGPFPAYVPVTNKNGKEWYYLVRLEFGI